MLLLMLMPMPMPMINSDSTRQWQRQRQRQRQTKIRLCFSWQRFTTACLSTANPSHHLPFALLLQLTRLKLNWVGHQWRWWQGHKLSAKALCASQTAPDTKQNYRTSSISGSLLFSFILKTTSCSHFANHSLELVSLLQIRELRIDFEISEKAHFKVTSQHRFRLMSISHWILPAKVLLMVLLDFLRAKGKRFT